MVIWELTSQSLCLFREGKGLAKVEEEEEAGETWDSKLTFILATVGFVRLTRLSEEQVFLGTPLDLAMFGGFPTWHKRTEEVGINSILASTTFYIFSNLQ